MYNLININCDLGEIDPSFQLEKNILPYVSMCNIACGGHAGNESSLKSIMEMAEGHKVLIGLHPSYSDPDNFGRISPNISKEQLRHDLSVQLEQGFSAAQKGTQQVHHIKAHGALYHDLSTSAELSNLFLDTIQSFSKDIKIMGAPKSMLHKQTIARKIDYIREGFGDRAYQKDGSLVPRSKNGSVYNDIEKITKQAIEIHNFKGVETWDGVTVDLEVDSICYHTDSTDSIKHIKELNLRLKQMGIEVYKISR